MELSTGGKVIVDTSRVHRILVGGDQMTAARIRSAQDAKMNSESAVQRFGGFISMFEDWYAKAHFMAVSIIAEIKFCTLISN